MRSVFRSLSRALPYIRPYWLSAVCSILLLLVGVAVSLVEPWPLAFLVDRVLAEDSAPGFVERTFGSETGTLILVAVVAGLGVTLISNLLAVVQDYVNTRLDQRMVLDFRSDIFRNAQRVSLAYHDSRRTGDFIARINMMAGSLGQIVVGLPPLIQSVLTLIGMFVVAYTIEPTIALLSLTVVPLIYWSTGLYSSKIEPKIVEVRNMEGQSLNIVHEAMSMLRVILAFGRETHEHRRFRTQGEQAVTARVRLTVRQTLFSLGVNTITAAGTALVLFVGAHRVVSDDLTVGQLLVIMSYIAAVYQPLATVSTTIATMQEQMVSFRMSLELLDTEPAVTEARHAISLDRCAGRITFENVSFTYEGRRRTIDSISFEAAPGDVVAVVGPTGAGKSTLMSLVPRFYDPAEGAVFLDDYDLRELTLESLRRQVSIVLQDPLLFSGTIGDNIRYGRLDATDDDMIEAAKAANAHDFIARLPRGYDTVVGERGAQLSGGERQRICVARAFLKDAPILILDEPTSSIDSRTEAVILDALDRLMVGRTTFIIAHRLSTVRRANQILVLKDGRLVEHGTHDELLRAGGLYETLHRAQIGSVLAPDARPAPGGMQPRVASAAPVANGSSDERPAPYYLNRASVEDLATLPGVGMATARAIVEARARLGRFAVAEDLLTVPGIGAARLERIRVVARTRANEMPPDPPGAAPPTTNGNGTHHRSQRRDARHPAAAANPRG